MSPTATGGIVFACTLAGILLGMWLRNRLPPHHLDNDTQSSVKEVNGLIATMTALILGLVTASAQDSSPKSEPPWSIRLPTSSHSTACWPALAPKRRRSAARFDARLTNA